MPSRLLLVAFALVALPPRAVTAQQPLTLREALGRADTAAFANRAAAGQRAAQEGAALAPYGGILPTVRVEGGVVRTTGPLNAFGFTLRQRLVTASAFAPARLNQPAATTNVGSALVLEQPLFNADAWLGRRAARAVAEAGRASERWTRAQTQVAVVRGYWGVVLAGARTRALETALAAARAHQRQAESLARQGMVTRADVLLAGVRAGEIEIDLLGAASDARAARLGLAILMGTPEDTGRLLPVRFPLAGVLVQRLEESTALPQAPRADIEAAGAASAAAQADRRRALALYLPRINGFGRIEWSSPDAPVGGQSAWTVGVMLTWTPFAGATEIGERRQTGGRAQTAHAMVDAARAEALIEQQQTGDAVQVAMARLGITARGVDQATEAHRIVGRKYDGGLATMSELLDAAAQENAATLADLAASYQAIVALAEVRAARGLDLSPLQDLDQGE